LGFSEAQIPKAEEYFFSPLWGTHSTTQWVLPTMGIFFAPFIMNKKIIYNKNIVGVLSEILLLSKNSCFTGVCLL
jgi:hypothetical protein